MRTTKQITIELPNLISGNLEALTREWAIVGLQQEGKLTIREAAGLLGLDYEDYLALLAKKGLPASNVVNEDNKSYKQLLAHAKDIAKKRQRAKI